MEKPNYYAIIIAEVRYDKSLTMGAKMLYGEISALANKEGYCWATNNYFAKLYEVSTRTITEWISQLIDREYILIAMVHEKTKTRRQIHLNREAYRRKLPEGVEENFYGGVEENFYQNNTRENNTRKNTCRKKNDPFVFNFLKSHFKEINPDYHHDGKQAKAITNLILWAKNDVQKIVSLVSKFLDIKDRDNSSFWYNSPATPASVYSKRDNILAYQLDGKEFKPLDASTIKI